MKPHDDIQNSTKCPFKIRRLVFFVLSIVIDDDMIIIAYDFLVIR